MINIRALKNGFKVFKGNVPFDHCVIDDFLTPKTLVDIQNEFLGWNSEKWFYYKNPLEDKKALNDWNAFPPVTYKLFSEFNSPVFVNLLTSLYGEQLFSDPGLHGGGWHCHGPGGNLNPHYDYSIHPKMGLQRTLNIIVYVSPTLKPEHGGHLGLWEHDAKTNRPGKLVKEVEPKMNRAVIFDTTQNSWHGMSRPLIQPEGVYRQSLAIYYLRIPSDTADPRGRALFAPRVDQLNNDEVESLIELRSNVSTSSLVYKK